MAREIYRYLEHRSNTSALFMGAVLVGGLVEAGRTIKANTKRNIADTIRYANPVGPSIIFFRGCGEDYKAQAPLFGEKLAQLGSLHFPYQEQGRHSQKIVDAGVIEACEEDGDRERVLICSSMGMMNCMNSLRNPDVRKALGKGTIRAIISRSGMPSKQDLQPEMLEALKYSIRAPKLASVSDAWRAYRVHKASEPVAHSPNSTSAAVRAQYMSSAKLPFPLVASQHKAIDRSKPWAPRSHYDVVEENPDMELIQISSDYDAVVDRLTARTSLELAFGIPVNETVDHRRPYGSHVDDIAFMEPLAYHMTRLSRVGSQALESVVNLDEYRLNTQYATAS